MSSKTAGKRPATSQTPEEEVRRRPTKRSRTVLPDDHSGLSSPKTSSKGVVSDVDAAKGSKSNPTNITDQRKPPKKTSKPSLSLGPNQSAIYRRLPPPRPLIHPSSSSSSLLPSQSAQNNPVREIVKKGLMGTVRDGNNGKGRKSTMVFVSRKAKMGGLIRRCKELLVDMG